jgi:hypothetical protein
MVFDLSSCVVLKITKTEVTFINLKKLKSKI